MAERIAHPVDRGRLRCQRLARRVRQHQGHRIEHHRRRARQLTVRRQALAVAQLRAADLRRDDLDLRALGFRRLAQRGDRSGIRAIVDQDAHAAALQRGLHLADDLQRG